MRRSPLPVSTKPMKRTELVRRTPLTHQPFAALKRRRAYTAWQAVRLLILARSEGVCECCGRQLDPLAWHCHHRKLKSQGGTDDPHNLLALRFDHHHDIHRGDRAAAEAAGLIVPSHADPAQVPVVLHGVDRMIWLATDTRPALILGHPGADDDFAAQLREWRETEQAWRDYEVAS